MCVIGSGYVGLTVGAVMADFGYTVVSVDSDEAKTAHLQRGTLPIFEPGLDELIQKNAAQGRLAFTTDIQGAIRRADIIFIAVGTPSTPEGRVDTGAVEAVARSIGQYVNGPKLVVIKSTVPTGTTERVTRAIAEELARRREGGGHATTEDNAPSAVPADCDVEVASCPEFLRESTALQDFLHPSRVVVGVNSPRAAEVIRRLYAKVNAPFFVTTPINAELIKYTSNAMLALKISFINEIASFCELVGADVQEVARGVALDHRIGPSYLLAGVGFGGSCFPKDTRALDWAAQDLGLEMPIVQAITEVNERQKRGVVHKLRGLLGTLAGTRVAVLGLSYKPNTDDIRDAPSLTVVRDLLAESASVVAYDPQAMRHFRQVFPQTTFTADPYEAVEEAGAAVLLTEWQEFRDLDMARVRRLMRRPVFLDGRNIFDPAAMRALGFQYASIGRV
ncbi:MAG: UDP-glucose/GDP-mannose dehydrogenase family protein [Chloroflexi bacterium]|nr:UDP-glucose/GDP-mannose dehydrogenase family protein [Chloroflexota bacterium]